jgi:hypothetical protein
MNPTFVYGAFMRTTILRRRRSARAGSCLACLLAGAAYADDFGTVVRDATPIVDLRLRSESVDQSGMANEADALTMRARLGVETGKVWGTSLLAEGVALWPLEDRYNSTVNGKTSYPTVADPEMYGINRLQLANTSLPGTTLIVGRQRINLDDQRFVGNSGWRQNEQTFEAAQLINKSIPHLTVDLVYLNQVNRVFGPDSRVGRYTGDSYLVNVSYDTPIGKLTAFTYLLDFKQALTDSSRTTGARFSGDRKVSTVKIAYMVSYADQSDYAHNPLSYSEGYYAAELTGSYRQFSLGGGFEMLQGNGVKGFATPLATFHRFDGWDDKFLTTPPNGLERRYVTLGYTAKSIMGLDSLGLMTVYHDFRSDHLDQHYGSEIDLQLQGKWRRFIGLVKFADYSAEKFATSTRKFWLEVDYVW